MVSESMAEISIFLHLQNHYVDQFWKILQFDLVQDSTISQSLADFSSLVKAFNFSPIKLETDNYLFWKAQILATIRALDLVQFLSKSKQPPTEYVVDPKSTIPDDKKFN